MFRLLKQQKPFNPMFSLRPRFQSATTPSPSPSPPPLPLPSASVPAPPLLIPILGVGVLVLGLGVYTLSFFVNESLPTLRALPGAIESFRAVDIPAIADEVKRAKISNMVEEVRKADVPQSAKVFGDVVKEGVTFKLFGMPVGGARVTEEATNKKK